MGDEHRVYFRDYTPDDLATNGPSCDVLVRVPPDGNPLKTSAFIDTGAGYTMIGSAFAKKLKAPKVGSASIRGIHGEQPCDIYRVDINLLPSPIVLNDWQVRSVTDIPGYGIILGRDFLRNGVFIYDGGGNIFVFFQTPEQLASPGENRLQWVSQGVQVVFQQFRQMQGLKH